MAPQLFVYYRVRATHRRAVVAALRALHAGWRTDEPALGCELMQRMDGEAADEFVTLMETYRHADGVSPAWQRRIDIETRAALAAWLVGERHVEVFAPCA